MKIKTLTQAFAFSLITFSASTFAHEPRPGVGGAYTITVGNRVEPAFSNEPNALDFIVSNLDGTAAEVTNIELNVTVLYLAEETFDAEVLYSAPLTGELSRDRTNTHRFNIPYMPTKVGTYGFQIKGIVDGVEINETFVCGEGTQNPEGSSFGCVTEIQKFPKAKQIKIK